MDAAITETGTRKVRRRTGATNSEPGDPVWNAPTHEDIARRAYELYVERGGDDGSDVDDWLRAEQELAAPSQSTRFIES
jgi:hypothetical protein